MKRGIDLWNSGLRIYTTIDSRLQRYAEEAVNEHMKYLQGEFTKQWEGRNPWVDDDRNEIPGFLRMRIKQSPAYKNLVTKYGEGSDSVRIMLNLKKPMSIFSWDGEIDTVFSSMDSLAYYKRFLQTGLMSMDPNTGHIKAVVASITSISNLIVEAEELEKRQPGLYLQTICIWVGHGIRLFPLSYPRRHFTEFPGFPERYVLPQIPMVRRMGEKMTMQTRAMARSGQFDHRSSR